MPVLGVDSSVAAQWGALLFPAEWRARVLDALEALPAYCHPSSGNINWKKVRAATGASAKLSGFLAPDQAGAYLVGIIPPDHAIKLAKISGVPIPSLAMSDEEREILRLARGIPPMSHMK